MHMHDLDLYMHTYLWFKNHIYVIHTYIHALIGMNTCTTLDSVEEGGQRSGRGDKGENRSVHKEKRQRQE